MQRNIAYVLEKKIYQLSAVSASSTESNELAADPRQLYKQYKFCEKQKELTDKFKARVFYIPFQDVSKKVQKFLTKLSNFPRTCHRETLQPLSPPPPPNVKLTFLVDKIDVRGFP